MPNRLSGRFPASQIWRQHVCLHTRVHPLAHTQAHVLVHTLTHPHANTCTHTHSGVALVRIFILGAKPLQSWLTLWDLMNCSPTGSSVHGILPWILEYSKNTPVFLPFPLSGNLPNPGIEPESPAAPAVQVDSLSLSYQGCPHSWYPRILEYLPYERQDPSFTAHIHKKQTIP